MSAHVALIVVAVVVPASNCLHFDRCIWPCSCCHLKVVAIVGFTHCGRTATAIEVDVAAAVSVAILEQEKLRSLIVLAKEVEEAAAAAVVPQSFAHIYV